MMSKAWELDGLLSKSESSLIFHAPGRWRLKSTRSLTKTQLHHFTKREDRRLQPITIP